MIEEMGKVRIERTHTDEKLRAEVAKLIEETGKARIERILYPFVVGGAFFAATAAFVKLFL